VNVLNSNFKRILVADDDGYIRNILKEALSTIDNTVIEIVEDGYQAVTQYKDHDLVLLDLQMPNMNGFESMQIIKTQNPNALIVAISADVQSKIKCLEMGFHDFIEKPFQFQNLINLVNSYLIKA